MFTINRLVLDIQASKSRSTSQIERFGFNIPFKKGLNVIKGENTSGKSTIISCLLYSLCLEELLGSKRLKALDKSLKSEFKIGETKHKVISSYIYIEIENTNGEIYTLKRGIKGDTCDEFTLKVIEGKYINIANSKSILTVFIHRKRNHESEISFYRWFANFLGIEIPKVMHNNGNMIALYLQTIFPAFFIEQSKGWSNFMASSPYFGIKNNNQRTIEYILGLSALSNEVEKDKLVNEENEIKKQWTITANKIEILAKENSGKVVEALNTPVKDSSSIDLISFKIRKSLSDNQFIGIEKMIKELINKYNSINTQPQLLKKISSEDRTQLEKKKVKYQNYKKEFNSFNTEFQAQQSQLKSYLHYLNELNEELEINKDIEYLQKKDPSVNSLELCPTCSNKIGNSIINNNLDVELKTIKGNIAYLENQKKLLENSILSLENIIEEKSLLNKLFINDINVLEDKIKAMHNEFCDPDKMPSRLNILTEVQTKIKIDRFKAIKNSLKSYKEELFKISKTYAKNQNDIDELKDTDDLAKLSNFENCFKNNLYDFGYKSNDRYEISIQKQFPFKYLPVSKIGNEVQKIQISSSSSDFIRAIWAYTISLLSLGVNNPGIVMFDEPSQHSMKRDSLEKLFKKLSLMNDKQIIIAASTEEHTKTEDGNEYSIDQALIGLTYEVYNIEERAIEKIN